MSEQENKILELIFTVHPHGWACFRYKNIQSADISYVCDPFTDLGYALIYYFDTQDTQSVYFDHEGDDSELIISSYGLTLINYREAVHTVLTDEELCEFAIKLADEMIDYKEDWVDAWNAYDTVSERDSLIKELEGLADVLTKKANQYIKPTLEPKSFRTITV